MKLLSKFFLGVLCLTVSSVSWAACPEGQKQTYKGCEAISGWPPAYWRTSCGVDPGSITRDGSTWTFKTSKNRCYKKGTTQIFGIFRQRAEIATHNHKLPPNVQGKYEFETMFTFKDNSFMWTEGFDIFQIHDGRDGCAPPLKVGFLGNRWDGTIRVKADYKTGPGESCIRDVMFKTGYQTRGSDTTKLLRNGVTQYKLNVVLDFDGEGGFDVEVYLNDILEIKDQYTPPETGYRSKHFFFKHGVYSKNIFDYKLISNMNMKRIQQ